MRPVGQSPSVACVGSNMETTYCAQLVSSGPNFKIFVDVFFFVAFSPLHAVKTVERDASHLFQGSGPAESDCVDGLLLLSYPT